MAQSPEFKIDHDHDHLTALLRDLGRSIQEWQAAVDAQQDLTGTTELLEEAREVFALLKDDTYRHFEAEEHGIFPNLEAEFPDRSLNLSSLRDVHDQICALLETIERQLGPPDGKPEAAPKRVLAVHTRLTDLFLQHTEAEWHLLRDLIGQLAPHRQAIILAELQEV